PRRIAAMRRHDQRAQYRGLRIRVDKGHVGMPRRRAISMSAVDVEHGLRALHRRYSRMRHDIAEQTAKGLVARLVEMLLPAKENHFVFEKRLANRFHRRGFQLS